MQERLKRCAARAAAAAGHHAGVGRRRHRGPRQTRGPWSCRKTSSMRAQRRRAASRGPAPARLVRHRCRGQAAALRRVRHRRHDVGQQPGRALGVQAAVEAARRNRAGRGHGRHADTGAGSGGRRAGPRWRPAPGPGGRPRQWSRPARARLRHGTCGHRRNGHRQAVRTARGRCT